VAWAPYDRLVRAASRYGITVLFNATAPGPLWAMGAHPSSSGAANHFEANAQQFGAFVQAAGTRYSGSYGGLPRVSAWSIWNEPNQPGWLAPQWIRVHGAWVANSPQLYRRYVDAAYLGLYRSGHAQDTILIGETAPSGYPARGALVAMKPLPFLRALYCLDGRLRRLTGSAATAIGCPARGTALSFALANSALFAATGFAHHPYRFTDPPDTRVHDADSVPLADLDRLERTLDGAFSAYGLRLQLPIFLTEYGYQTDPPDPHVVVSPSQQAAYLNVADHLAWRDSRVRAMAQFLLRDDLPDPRYHRAQFKYWDTFQTGLEFSNGRAKPALAAYRLPLWVSGRNVWGRVRPASRVGAQTARIQWRAVGGRSWRTLAGVRTDASGFVQARVRAPRRGVLRLLWRHFTSRSAPVG
jgi:hypothetical protein